MREWVATSPLPTHLFRTRLNDIPHIVPRYVIIVQKEKPPQDLALIRGDLTLRTNLTHGTQTLKSKRMLNLKGVEVQVNGLYL